jgi:AraC-like DNA-binding protein
MLTAAAIDLPDATEHRHPVADAEQLPAEAAEKVFALAGEHGVRREELLAAAGLASPAALTFEQLCSLYEQAARLTGDPAFGLHVGERTSPRMYGLLGYAASNSLTLGEAVGSLIELQPLWTAAAGLELRRARGTFVLGYWHRGALPAAARRHESEQMLAAILAFVRHALGERVRPAELRFEHDAPGDLAEHARIFEAPVLFGAPATEIVFADALLARPLAAPDLVLGDLIRAQAVTALAGRTAPGDFAERLRTTLRESIAAGSAPTLARAAAEMGLGPRSFQRRLAARGIRFRALCDALRIEAGRRLLVDSSLGLAEIAHRLGYSQPSAFHRAFMRAEGSTPREFRLKLRGSRGG